MRPPLPFFRPLALLVLLVMGVVAAIGFHSIRRDIDDLQVMSRDNILWSATQMEIELLRFQRALAVYASERSEEALADLHERLDILWSRLSLFTGGRVGQILRDHDDGHGTLEKIAAYLATIDPVILAFAPGADPEAIPEILHEMDALQSEMRAYSLRVVWGDTAAASEVRERMRASARLTGIIALGAILICLLALVLIARDNRRQREMAAISLRQAEAAHAASRAKSRFLSMMSHELRNPLNGILGPLALIGQTEIGERQLRLLERAQQHGRIMLRMLRGLLDYGDTQDGRLALREEAFRPQALADEITAGLSDAAALPAAQVEVVLSDEMPDMLWGDLDRLAQIVIYLGEYVRSPDGAEAARIALSYADEHLLADIAVPETDRRPAWKLDFLTGLGGEPERTFAADALGPLIAQGLLRAVGGLLTLTENGDCRRVIRVAIPARRVVFEQIRVHVETRSAALETLYRAALKSDRIRFLSEPDAVDADVVLIDSTSVGPDNRTQALRARFPRAIFVSLGLPIAPGCFDEIVEVPSDIVLLRERVLGRLAF